VVLDGVFTLTFDSTHLFQVVARERPIDIGHVDIVTVCDRPGFESAALDLRPDELDGYPPAFEVWLVV
jgi:hypothetical protein